MKIKYLIGLVMGLILVALLLPILLVMLSDISAVVVIGGEQVRVPKADATVLTLLTVLLPIFICIGFVMQFMGSRRELSICKSCIWFLRDLTCEKDLELDCTVCEGLERE